MAGFNKGIQTKYWNLVHESNWKKYRIPSTIKGVDSIIEHIILDDPDFSDLDELTEQIEEKTLSFIDDVKDFLFEHPV